jgi:hypothetical protein
MTTSGLYLRENNFEQDLRVTTRTLVLKSVKEQMIRPLPLLNLMDARGLVEMEASLDVRMPLDTVHIDDLDEGYTDTTVAKGGRKQTLDDAVFTTRKTRMPIELTEDEELGNTDNPDRVVDLAARLAAKVLIGKRRALAKRMLGVSPITNALEVSSDDKRVNPNIQSIRQALGHDLQYGNLTRTIGSHINDWWQSASPAGTYADQATAATFTLANIKAWINLVAPFCDNPQTDLRMFVGPVLWEKAAAQVEARYVFNGDPLGKGEVGFERIQVGPCQIIKDYNMDGTQVASTANLVLLLDLPTWKLKMHPKRNFLITPFIPQDEHEGGRSVKLAWCKNAMKFVCNRPHSNMMLTNVS